MSLYIQDFHEFIAACLQNQCMISRKLFNNPQQMSRFLSFMSYQFIHCSIIRIRSKDNQQNIESRQLMISDQFLLLSKFPEESFKQDQDSSQSILTHEAIQNSRNSIEYSFRLEKSLQSVVQLTEDLPIKEAEADLNQLGTLKNKKLCKYQQNLQQLKQVFSQLQHIINTNELVVDQVRGIDFLTNLIRLQDQKTIQVNAGVIQTRHRNNQLRASISEQKSQLRYQSQLYFQLKRIQKGLQQEMKKNHQNSTLKDCIKQMKLLSTASSSRFQHSQKSLKSNLYTNITNSPTRQESNQNPKSSSNSKTGIHFQQLKFTQHSQGIQQDESLKATFLDNAKHFKQKMGKANQTVFQECRNFNSNIASTKLFHKRLLDCQKETKQKLFQISARNKIHCRGQGFENRKFKEQQITFSIPEVQKKLQMKISVGGEKVRKKPLSSRIVNWNPLHRNLSGQFFLKLSNSRQLFKNIGSSKQQFKQLASGLILEEIIKNDKVQQVLRLIEKQKYTLKEQPNLEIHKYPLIY